MTKFFLPEVIVGSRRSLDDAPLTLVRVPRCTEADDQTPDRSLNRERSGVARFEPRLKKKTVTE